MAIVRIRFFRKPASPDPPDFAELVMFARIFRSLLVALLVLVSGAAPDLLHAQTTTVPITFTGTVAASVGDTVRIKQADGTYAAYTGPLPTFPYQDGQQVAISFNATVPSAAWYAANPAASAMMQSADGQYRITLYPGTSGLGGLGIPGIGTADTVQVSGAIDATGNPRIGGGSMLAMTLMYNATNDTYSVANGSSFVAGYFAGPGFVYDGTTGELIACSGAACDPAGTGADLFGLTGNTQGAQVSAFNIPILDSLTGALDGLYTLTFSGTWSFGGLASGGGSITAVPEPGMLAMFAGATLVPVWRRRQARARKAP